VKETHSGWKVAYIYGSFKTAQSVAEKMRREGKKAWAKQQTNGDTVVLVPPVQSGK